MHSIKWSASQANLNFLASFVSYVQEQLVRSLPGSLLMARIKLAYPKMPSSGHAPLAKCIAFEKYDGSNLHWVWDEDLGWHAFGSRRDRFDLDESGCAAFAVAHPELSEAPALFMQTLAVPLSKQLSDSVCSKACEVIAFTEFFGESSFAGRHRQDEPKQLILFDIAVENQFLPPEVFVTEFAELPIARVVYRGKLTGKFAEDVRQGKYDVAEGVVCKGSEVSDLWMAKIKTNSYMKRLQEAFAENWEIFWE
jgi:hypothetical protein